MAIQRNDSFEVLRNIQNVPLTQVLFRDKWRPKYIFPWNKRPLYIDVKSDNPYALINYQRTIKLVK